MTEGTSPTAVHGSPKALETQAGKYLTFALDGDTYGLEILKVQEIIGMLDVTRIPKTPGFVRGVINLRGKVIPVVDLRLKFGLEGKEDTDRTCIIVVQVSHAREGDPMTTGVIVDEVSEVLDLGVDQIEPTPSFGAGLDTHFILGMGKIGQKVVTLLDVDSALGIGEVGFPGESTQHPPPKGGG